MAIDQETGVPEEVQKQEAPDSAETGEENIPTEKEAERPEEGNQENKSEEQEEKENAEKVQQDARDLADEILEYSKDLPVDKAHVAHLVGRIKEDPVSYGAYFLALKSDSSHAEGSKAIEKKFGSKIDEVLAPLQEKRQADNKKSLDEARKKDAEKKV